MGGTVVWAGNLATKIPAGAGKLAQLPTVAGGPLVAGLDLSTGATQGKPVEYGGSSNLQFGTKPIKLLQRTIVASTGGGDETLASGAIRETTLQGSFTPLSASSKIKVFVRALLRCGSDGTSNTDRRGLVYCQRGTTAGAGNTANGTSIGRPINWFYGRLLIGASTVASDAAASMRSSGGATAGCEHCGLCRPKR